MTTVTASCPDCGQVEMTADAVTLMVCNHAPLSYYEFPCLDCGNKVRKPADNFVISLLLSAGIRAQVWTVPAEALEPKAGPTLTPDDLLDFAISMRHAPDALVSHLAAEVDR